ncbi:ABC transporter F family member 3 [Camellia lanceoleosa]|uniref:ABC transporter F family member 3 n=1 Tax=Camellia lanceoleosa TaxID=1840588 RepID=A0ACC0IIN7_9ERIC|nr:ABC transporter F family member 3 [Camellia lanceoleosa]
MEGSSSWGKRRGHHFVCIFLPDFILIDLVLHLGKVSDDEHLISGSVEQLWAVSEGKVTPFTGTFQDYKKILQS